MPDSVGRNADGCDRDGSLPLSLPKDAGYTEIETSFRCWLRLILQGLAFFFALFAVNRFSPKPWGFAHSSRPPLEPALPLCLGRENLPTDKCCEQCSICKRALPEAGPTSTLRPPK